MADMDWREREHWRNRIGAVVKRWAARGALARLPQTRDRLVSRLEALGARDTLAGAPDFRLEIVVELGRVRCEGDYGLIGEWDRLLPGDPPRHPVPPGHRGAPPETLATARRLAGQSIARMVRDHDNRCLPTIRRLREKGYGWRRIAGALDREIEPPGRRASYSEGRWSGTAVLRIARRNGID